MSADLQALIESGEAPGWLKSEGYRTLRGGYLLENETPRGMYMRVAKAAASYYKDAETWEKKFFDAMWNNWLCPATPVLTNMGTNRGLSISCLTGETWISTEIGGAKQIKDIIIGDKVLTHEGRFKKVSAIQSRMSCGDLYEIKVGTRLTKTKITGNHPILTNLGWVKVEDLDLKTHIVAVNSEIEYRESVHTIELKNYVNYPNTVVDGRMVKLIENNGPEHKKKKSGVVDSYTKPFAKINVDDDIAWAIGLWTAEGSLSRGWNKKPNGIRITLGADEEVLGARWLKIFQEKFGLNGSSKQQEFARPNFAKGKTTRWLNVNVNGLCIGEMFAREFGIDRKSVV